MVRLDTPDLLSQMSSLSQPDSSQQGNAGVSQCDVQQTLSATINYNSWQPSGQVPTSTSMDAVEDSFASFQPSIRVQNMSYPANGHFQPHLAGDLSSQTSSASILNDVLSRESISDAPTRRESQGSQVTQAKRQSMARVANAPSTVQSAPARNGTDVSAIASSTEAVHGAGWRPGQGNPLKNIEAAIQSFWLVSENRMQQMHEELRSVSVLVNSSHFGQEQTRRHVAEILALQVQITEKTVRAADERKFIFGRIKTLEEKMTTQHTQVQEALDLMRKELKEGLESIVELTQKGRKPPAAKSAGNGAAAKNGKAGSPTSKKTATSATNAKKRKQSSVEGIENVCTPSADVGQPSTLR
ncbi:uncharacterized protein PAN0_017c5463 [Moesziomyces antarcticus]|uniref:Uncharacterized protein n=2 Tax=Pseudozyma antarctica TaxID=84753 RepID=A0A081CKP0_PSEA2|nr:uncharacterized protein PAN0_017c5463 [Moesziomyces antarcticus]GAK67236.1 hypothetical protein PAN0_017c5463 [Moesziomyces antarcticus]SPO48156.1 uncharacterized protein PSANT_05844 [Moesziomyces antarcticus]